MGSTASSEAPQRSTATTPPVEAYAIQLASARNAYVKQLEGEDAAEELRRSIETFATALRNNVPEEVRDIKTTRQRKIIEAMATAIKQEQEARGLQGLLR